MEEQVVISKKEYEKLIKENETYKNFIKSLEKELQIVIDEKLNNKKES